MKKYSQTDGKEKTLKLEKHKAVLLCITFLLVVTACVFSVLCMTETVLPFFRKNVCWLSWVICVLYIVSFVVSLRWLCKGKETLFKTVFSGIILLVSMLILLYLLLRTGFFSVIKSKKGLEEYLSKTGAWMPIFYVVLQFLQVVVLPIPSTVSTLAGVALFGPLQAFLYSFIGIMLGSLTAFFVGRNLGHKAVAWIVGRDTLKKWQTRLKGKDNFLLTLMFILPVFPDDILCFVAGLSSMSNAYFIVMLSISRVLSILTTCYSVQFIPFNTLWGAIVWGVFFAAVVVGFIIVYKYSNQIQGWLNRQKQKFQKKKNK